MPFGLGPTQRERVSIVVRAVGEIIGLVLNLVATVWMSRTVGPTFFGYLAVTVTLVSLGAIVVNAGLSTAGSQRVANDPARAGEVVWVVTIARLAIAGVAILLAEAILAVTPVAPVLREYLRIGVLAWVALPFRTEWLLVAQGRVRAISVLRIVGSATMAFVAVALLRDASDADRLAWVPVAAAAVAALAGWSIALRSSPPGRPSWSVAATMRAYFSDGFHYLKSDASMFIFNSSDRLFLYVFATPAVVGLYDAAYRVIQPFYLISSVVGDAMYLPLARAIGTERLAPVFRRYVDLMGFATIPLGFFLVRFAPQVISILYGPVYADASAYLAILGWVITFGYTSGIAVLPFTAWNRPREYGNATAAGGVLNLALNLLLIPLVGGLGAALATVAAKVAVTVAGLRHFRLVTSYPIVRDFREYVAISALALLASAATRLISDVPVVAEMMLFGMVYVGFVAAVRWRRDRTLSRPEFRSSAEKR